TSWCRCAPTCARAACAARAWPSCADPQSTAPRRGDRQPVGCALLTPRARHVCALSAAVGSRIQAAREGHRLLVVEIVLDRARSAGSAFVGERGRAGVVAAVLVGVLGLWAVMLAGRAAAAPLPAGCSYRRPPDNVATCSFAFSRPGGPQSFTVPSGGVQSVGLDVVGGDGGGNPGGSSVAGAGGEAKATLPVSAGDVLEVLVGGHGEFGEL